MKQILIKILYKKLISVLYKLISILDYADYHYIRKEKLIDDYKTIEEIELPKGIEILTDTGYKPLSHIMVTKPFEQYIIKLENGYELNCADEHKVFDENFNEIFVKDLSIGQYIQTDVGLKKVVSLDVSPTKISMCDTTVDDNNHRFYSNGILSHNSTTTAIYCLWVILFNVDKVGLILSKSGPAGVDLLKKIKDMYLYLPYFLKVGTLKWNQGEISFDNNSSISTEAFSPTAGLGKTINFLILDEFAWCPPNDVDLFYNNIIPTITTISDSNVCIMSTQNGFNLFYKLWHAAETHQNIYAPFKVDWQQVPQWNPETKTWDKRDENWKKMMVGILGSEQAFYYQYGTMFSASDKCLVSRETLGRMRDHTVLYENNKDWPYFSLYNKFLMWHPEFNIVELKTGWFIILVDLAEGGGNDYTIFNILQVVGKDKFCQVGYWRSNTVDLEHAALEFWVLFGEMFDQNRAIVSIEWNTYGALFYNYLMQLNENQYMPENSWRFLVNRYGEFDMNCIIHYKRGTQEEELAGIGPKIHKSMIPGIRFSGANKVTACALLKMLIERDEVEIFDLLTISELENFEDKNGNGRYAAAYGHDDLIMTFCQLPMVKNTPKYKDFMEEYELATKLLSNLQSPISPTEMIQPLKQQVDLSYSGYIPSYIVGVNVPPYNSMPMDSPNFPMSTVNLYEQNIYDGGSLYNDGSSLYGTIPNDTLYGELLPASEHQSLLSRMRSM